MAISFLKATIVCLGGWVKYSRFKREQIERL